MSKGVKFNVILSINGKDVVVQCKQGVQELGKALGTIPSKAEQGRQAILKWAGISSLYNNLYSGLQQLTGAMQPFIAKSNAATEAQTKLTTVMRQRMNATQADTDAVNKAISAQTKLGVVGGTVQRSGLQQLATFASQRSTLETLLPAMNNLLAQQKGVNATSEDAVGVANLMGKALMGNVGALTRVGITLTDHQKELIRTGDEYTRATTLAQAITDNVGNMNAEIAKTDAGKAKQLANAFGGLQVKVGIHAVLADGRYHLVRHPPLELFRRRKLGREDKGIKARLVDDGCVRFVIRTGTLNQGSGFVFAIDVSSKCIFWLGIPQRLRHVFSYEPRLIVHHERSHLPKFGALKISTFSISCQIDFSLIRFDWLCVLPAGLPPPSATLRHTNLGSLAGALCVRTMRFLHLTARLPYQGFSLFVCPNMSKNVCRAPVCELPEGRPVRDVLVFERVSPLQGYTLFQVSLYVVDLVVGKIRRVAFFNFQLNDLAGGIDSLESLIVAVLDESVRELLFVVFQLSDAPP